MDVLIDLVSDSDDEESLPSSSVPLPSSSKTTVAYSETEDEEQRLENTLVQLQSAGSKRQLTQAEKLLAAQIIGDKKRKLENEKIERALRVETVNAYKPGKCIKNMVVEIHPLLAGLWFMSNVGHELAAAGARLHVMETVVHPALMLWSRITPVKLPTESGQERLSEAPKQCEMALYISTTLELGDLIANKKLVTHVSNLRDMVETDMSMVVYGDYKNYCRKTINPNREHMTQERVDEAKIELMIETGVDMQFIDKQSDLATWVVQCTKGIAEGPYRNEKSKWLAENVNFYLKGDNKNCVAVNKDGEGLSRLWQQMIAVLPSSSLEIARALCGKYKTPFRLIEALEKPKGVEELSNVEVSRSGVPGAKSRRIGNELAKKIQQLYISKDPDLVLT